MPWSDYRDAVLSSAPAVYYPMHQTSGTTTFDLIMGLSASLSANATFSMDVPNSGSSARGYYGSGSGSLYCNGPGGAVLQRNSVVDVDLLSGTYTIEFWYRHDAGTSRVSYPFAGRGMASGSNLLGVQFYVASNGQPAIYWKYLADSPLTYSIQAVYFGPLSYASSFQEIGWHHLVWVYSGSAVDGIVTLPASGASFYVDGISVLPASGSGTGLLTQATITGTYILSTPWTVLCSGTTTSYSSSQDRVLDFAFYTRAITAEEVFAHYQAGVSWTLDTHLLTSSVTGDAYYGTVAPAITLLPAPQTSSGGSGTLSGLYSKINPGLN